MEMMDLSVEQLKNWKPSPEQKMAAEVTFLAMAVTETIRPVVVGYQSKILELHKFKFKKKEERDYFFKKTGKDYCTDSEHTYLISDKDFKVYLDECEDERKKAKLSIAPHKDGEGYCPLLMAEEDQRQAEHILMDCFEPLTGINRSNLWKLEWIHKYKELLLGLMAPHINKEEILARIKK
jgi:hypothetical protein